MSKNNPFLSATQIKVNLEGMGITEISSRKEMRRRLALLLATELLSSYNVKSRKSGNCGV